MHRITSLLKYDEDEDDPDNAFENAHSYWTRKRRRTRNHLKVIYFFCIIGIFTGIFMTFSLPVRTFAVGLMFILIFYWSIIGSYLSINGLDLAIMRYQRYDYEDDRNKHPLHLELWDIFKKLIRPSRIQLLLRIGLVLTVITLFSFIFALVVL